MRQKGNAMKEYLEQGKKPQGERRAVLLRPGGKVETFPGEGKGNKVTLEQAQKLVGGYVERVNAPGGCILADEDGYSKQLLMNVLPFETAAGSEFVGPVLYIPRGMGW